jgi:hypothetical protein
MGYGKSGAAGAGFFSVLFGKWWIGLIIILIVLGVLVYRHFKNRIK